MEIAAVSALAVNAGALVWNAAKMSAAVDGLKEITKELKELQMSLSNKVHALMARVYLLEDRAGIKHIPSED